MEDILKEALMTVADKGVILYPTDTVWGIGCDATDARAVSKIFEIKKRNESKSFVVLVADIAMLQDYVDAIPKKALAIIKAANKPTTIIYKNPKGLAKNVIAEDATVAIRVVNDFFCEEFIKKLGKPIVSTSANISGTPTPQSFKEIDKSILDAVDYVVNLRQNEITNTPSTIIQITNGEEVKVIRA
tara:strand:- start:134922 stop:135482 length:561 start_codon:yes stop_codon:yes gene_type:complete